MGGEVYIDKGELDIKTNDGMGRGGETNGGEQWINPKI